MGQSMNDPDEPLKDDIYSKESPLPGTGSPFGTPGASAPPSSNAFSIHFLTDLFFPFLLTHLIYWPVLWIGLAAVLGRGESYVLIWLPVVLATAASIVGGACYGWHIGHRFTNVAYITPDTNRKTTLNQGRRNQILMSVFQAVLFPSLFWGGCMAIVSLG